jgi:serine/threonine protein kinase
MPKSNPQGQGQNRYTFASGARPLDGYTIKRAIGRGGFGEVYYATSDSGKEVALKLVLRNLDVEKRGVVQCMNLKCPNLLTVYDLRTNDAGDAFVIMEYVSGPSLASVLAKHPDGMPLDEVRAWLKGLVEGVAYLHDHGIVHRDLKPANLFVEEGIVKIGDYGLAKLITPSHGTEHSESIGTCHYMAPEIASGKYNTPIDVYAIGVILYEMLTGRVPFEGETVGEVLMKHLTSRPDVSMLAEPYRSIVAKALSKDPNHRQARVYELLPPDDAPSAPSFRFIGDGKDAPPSPARDAGAKASPAAPKEKEEVYRIEAEEPVFYIGPETRPPASAMARLRANWAAIRCNRARQRKPGNKLAAQPQPQPRPNPPRPQAQPPRQVRRVAMVSPKPKPTPPPPPEPVPLASRRVRIADLSSSMLKGALLSALFTYPASLMLEIDPSRSPEWVSFLFATTLLGVWGTLAAGKIQESLGLGRWPRRGLALLTGVGVGLACLAFGSWVGVGTLPATDAILVHSGFPRGKAPEPQMILLFFSLVSLVSGWPRLATYDRPHWFRFWPVLLAGGTAAALSAAASVPEQVGMVVAVLIAVIAQLVAPWNGPAAAYARYAAWAAKHPRKAA